MRRLRILAAVVPLAAYGFLLAGSPAGAATTLVVTTTADGSATPANCTDGNAATDCSLRDAIAAATSSDGDTIELQTGVTYKLTDGELDHSGGTPLTIVGNGSTIDAQGSSRILKHGSGELILQDLTLTGGKASSVAPETGGAVQAAGPVLLAQVQAYGNEVESTTASAAGGAVYATGLLQVSGGAFWGNTATKGGLGHAYGGALYGDDVVDIGNGTEFHNNTAGLGGAVWGAKRFNVSDATFSSNLSDESAGAIGTDGFANADDATFENNLASGSTATGGAVYTGGAFSTTSSSFAGNTAVFGGAVYAGTELDGATMTVTGNQALGTGASGGGLYSAGTLTVSSSTVTGNQAVDVYADSKTFPKGGGIYAASLVILDSTTVSQNVALYDGVGGGVYSQTGIQLNESTVTDNTAQTDPDEGTGAGSSGGGLAAPSVTMQFSTVAGNGAATGADIAARSLRSSASVVAYASGGSACAVGATTSAGYSYDDDGSCGFTAAHDTSAGPDPRLGPLAENGGPTPTRSPVAGSPLVDAIPSGSCPGCDTTDQRGIPRPQGSGYDIGAVEVIGGVVVSPRFTG